MLLIKLKETVYLPRFKLKRGELWNYNEDLERHSDDIDGVLSVGGGKIKPEQYEVVNEKNSFSRVG